MNKRHLEVISLILVIIWAARLSMAQTKTNSPTKTQGSTQGAKTENILIINGKKISSRVLVTNNVKYVAIEDLANGLNGSVTYKGNEILVNLPILQKVSIGENSINSVSTRPGTVKGILTYNTFNSNDANRPDVGAKIYLVEGFIAEIPEQASISNTNNILNVGSSTSGWKEYRLINQTTADESGSYGIENVPPGKYSLVVQSSHAKALNIRDSSGKVQTKNIFVESGKTADGVFNFGLTAN